MAALTIQVELIWSIIIITGLCIVFIILGKKVKAADPTSRPHGVVLVVETGVGMLYNYFKGLMPAKFEKNYFPYFSALFIFILCSNLASLFAIESPTSNFSITLSLAIITFVLIQLESIRTNGGFGYIKNLLWPPTNILGTIAPLISLSMRLFGNILAGSIIMYLVYSLTGWLSAMLIPFNFLGPIVTPVLHLYFDIFAGVIQTLVFVTLSAILIEVESAD